MNTPSRNLFIAIALLIALGFGAWFILTRVFTPAPATPATNVLGEEHTAPLTGQEYIETRINAGATALGITVLPLEVMEDSRCPSGVQCIWAGTVRVRAQVTTSATTTQQMFSLNVPVVIDGLNVVLVKVEPAPVAGAAILPRDYRFTFIITSSSFVPDAKG